jgi:hypothetical protein
MIFLQTFSAMSAKNATNMAQVAIQQNLIKKSRDRIDLSEKIGKKPMHNCMNG